MGNQVQIESQSSEDQEMSIHARAPDDVISRFLRSYGVRSTLMSFFCPLEVTSAQILSKKSYEKWIAEVQTRFRLHEEPFLFYFKTSDRKAFFWCFDMAKNQLIKRHAFKE